MNYSPHLNHLSICPGLSKVFGASWSYPIAETLKAERQKLDSPRLAQVVMGGRSILGGGTRTANNLGR